MGWSPETLHQSTVATTYTDPLGVRGSDVRDRTSRVLERDPHKQESGGHHARPRPASVSTLLGVRGPSYESNPYSRGRDTGTETPSSPTKVTGDFCPPPASLRVNRTRRSSHHRQMCSECRAGTVVVECGVNVKSEPSPSGATVVDVHPVGRNSGLYVPPG